MAAHDDELDALFVCIVQQGTADGSRDASRADRETGRVQAHAHLLQIRLSVANLGDQDVGITLVVGGRRRREDRAGDAHQVQRGAGGLC
jgi:hypothetical protein